MKGFEFLANLDYSLLACSQLTTLKIMARTLLDGKDKELIQAGLRKKKNPLAQKDSNVWI